jgi:PAS domain S-box-containing protein
MPNDGSSPLENAIRELRSLAAGFPRGDALRNRLESAAQTISHSVAAMLERSVLGVVRTDLRGMILEANAPFARMLGYGQPELVGRSAVSLTHSGDIERERETVRDAIAGSRDVWRMRKRFVHKDGHTVWASLSILISRGETGQAECLIGLVEDITENVKAEEGLRRRDGILDAVAFAAGRFIGSGSWENCITEVLERLGRSEGVGRAYLFENRELDGKNRHAALRYAWRTPDVTADSPFGSGKGGVLAYDAGLERWLQLMEKGSPVLGHVRQFPESERAALASGQVKSTVVVPIFVAGFWWGFLGFDECVSEREWHPAEIDAMKTAAGILGSAIGRRLSEGIIRRMATAVEQAVESIVITDRDGAVEYVNPAFEQITGYAREEAFGKKLSMLKSGKHDAGFYREMWETINSGRIWEGRIINRRKNGDLYNEDATISPIRDENGVITHFVSVRRDVTHEVKMEEQLRRAQKMEAIGLLSGGVAHDFGNILTPIMAYADMVVSGLDRSSPVVAYVQEIQKAAARAEKLIRQMMTFSRKKEVELRSLDLNTVIEGVRKMLERLMREDIELVFELTAPMGRIRADSTQMEQILMNLSANSRDAMPSGGRLVIRTETAVLATATTMEAGIAPAGRYVVLSVRDTGCGVDAETRAQVFDPFFSTKGGAGTGLGLSTVYGIVKQHGASIALQSEIGKGTVFSIYFPECSGKEEEKEKPDEPLRDDKPGGSETVMVVEDDPNVRVLASEILKKQGYQVLDFEDPTRALHFVKRMDAPIHLLLTDVVMPRMNGRELCLRLQALRPSLKVLYMSGYSGSTIDKYGVLDGNVHFLKKPFSVQTLSREVRRALDA